MNYLLIFLGGGVGSVLRYAISVFVKSKSIEYPWVATFSVNVIGSFILGYLLGYFLKINQEQTGFALALTAGFCGGFTTFSTFSLDVLHLIKSGVFLQAGLYIIGSLILSLGAAFIGYQLSN